MLALREGRSYMQVVKDSTLLAEALKPAAIKHLTAFVTLIDTMRSRKEELDPDEFLKYIIHATGITKMYSDGSLESESKLENIDELLNAVSEFVTSKVTLTYEVPSIDDFVREMALYTDRDATEDDERPKVTLMTMHASKGLEFPHVYIVGLEEGLIPSERSSTEAGVEEERRLLYVAITRAKEKCTLSFACERMTHGKTNMSAPSRFIFDLDPAYIEDYAGILSSRKPVSPGSRPIPQPSSSDEPKRRMTRIIRKPTAPSPAEEVATMVPEVRDVAFKQGEYVYHDRFGRGLVEGFTDSISGTKVHIDFEDEGRKILIVKFARLRKE